MKPPFKNKSSKDFELKNSTTGKQPDFLLCVSHLLFILHRGLIGGWQGVRRVKPPMNPLPTPYQPPGNPLATLSRYRINPE